ncbi:protein of unknown function (plasmid) [Cupriavidus neocaledonicus]|uniref:Uncharacterized protein n=1 Tax=Cupriavidus neocaledonicus TaxID=1040979 RepID=A0A375HNQ9_9BURK|nr:hypothetical protein CBM2605_B130142 [Cupriavidus neocaledonicus]SPD59512.1 protein of unknown function [Cupriavidus neocaledonicus]
MAAERRETSPDNVRAPVHLARIAAVHRDLTVYSLHIDIGIGNLPGKAMHHHMPRGSRQSQ